MRKLQDIKELKRIAEQQRYRACIQQFRILRNQFNIEQFMEQYLYYMADIKSFQEILDNPNYGHRVEKVLYAYFISSKGRLNKLIKLSNENEDMLYILKNLYLHTYLYTCTEEWNTDNYSERMNLQLNSLFNDQIKILENIGNVDDRIDRYIEEQLNLKDDYEIKIRNFNKKYLKDGMVSLLNRTTGIYFKIRGVNRGELRSDPRQIRNNL